KSNESSPGPSGLSYRLLKLLHPQDLETIYNQLAACWTNKHIPDWWLDKLLVPLPKTTDPSDVISLSKLRPITLIEILRKLWVDTVFSPCVQFWEANDLIHQTSHGYRFKKGCDTALLNLINLQEEVQQRGGGTCISTWDMRKAFDTVHPDFVRVASTEYYVRLNSAGRIIVRSPYAQHHIAQNGYRLLNHIDDNNREGLSYFTAGRGIGQGDVTSAIIWLLVFDVLLTALDIGSTDPLHPTKQRLTTCSSSGILQTNNETCFSDDLTSASPSFSIRQRKADIVSAFATMFKLTIAQDKLRSLVQEWGHEPLGPDPGIYLHLPNWTKTAPLIQESHQCISSLGINLDDDNSGATQFAHTLKYIKNTLGRVRRVRGNPQLKILVLRSAFFPAVVYRLQHMTWPLAVFEKLAASVHSFLYKTLKLYLGFPKHLLHLPTHLGGFGIPDLCAYAQKTKYSIICRHLRADSTVQHSIDSLLTRAHTTNGSALQPGAPVSIPFPTAVQTQISTSLWTTSLLQFLHRHKLQLTKGGKQVVAGPDEPLVDYLFRHGYPSSHLNQVLTLHNICTVSDAFNRHTSRWLPAIKHLLQAAGPAAPLPDLPDSLSPTSIRIGQLWHTHAPCLEEPSFRAAAPNGIVLEIRGWLDPHTIAVQLWTGSSSSQLITTARKLFLATPS
ncbi:MAG: hypothetical protein EBU88_15635, partial [Acidobacteria bacterium]|nr:hypothetical protein [Acidobacteriota bacterium]